MPTYRERFVELSDQAVQQIERWKAGDRNHGQIIETTEKIKNLLINWEQNGEDRNAEYLGL